MRVRHHTPEQFEHMRQPYRLRPLRPLRRASGRHAGHICSPLSSLSAAVCYRLKGSVTNTGEFTYFGFCVEFVKFLEQNCFLKCHWRFVMNVKHVIGIMGCVVVLTAPFSAARAQSDYPNRSVRIVVPFAPGGVVDVMARLLAAKLSVTTGKTFYLENAGGAGGSIGTQKVATAPKDGYTLLITSSSFVVNPALQKVPYHPVKDFEPVTIAAASPNLLVVNPASPYKTVKDLVAAAKSPNTNISYSTAGVGTTPHLSGELLNLIAGNKLIHIPYTGSGPALQATIGGHTDVSFSGLPPAVGMVKQGQLRALGVTSAKRSEALPDVATMAEQGFSGQEAETLIFVLAPAGTPKAIVQHLSDLFSQLLQLPEVRKEFFALGFSPLALTPVQSSARIEVELDKWSKLIEASNLKSVAK